VDEKGGKLVRSIWTCTQDSAEKDDDEGEGEDEGEDEG
jgi:hypothetical protein